MQDKIQQTIDSLSKEAASLLSKKDELYHSIAKLNEDISSIDDRLHQIGGAISVLHQLLSQDGVSKSTD